MLGERLRTIREKQGQAMGRKIYQRDAARLLAISEHQYRHYEYGRAQLPEKHARTLAAEWGRSWQEFYQLPARRAQLGKAHFISEAGLPGYSTETIDAPLPYVGYLREGAKVNLLDPLNSDNSEYVPYEMAVAGRFVSRIHSDACFPWLTPEDVAIWHADESPRIGAIILHRTLQDIPSERQLTHDGERYLLHAANPAYEDVQMSGTIVGYLVAVVRQVGDLRLTAYKKGAPLLPADLRMLGTPG